MAYSRHIIIDIVSIQYCPGSNKRQNSVTASLNEVCRLVHAMIYIRSNYYVHPLAHNTHRCGTYLIRPNGRPLPTLAQTICGKTMRHSQELRTIRTEPDLITLLTHPQHILPTESKRLLANGHHVTLCQLHFLRHSSIHSPYTITSPAHSIRSFCSLRRDHLIQSGALCCSPFNPSESWHVWTIEGSSCEADRSICQPTLTCSLQSFFRSAFVILRLASRANSNIYLRRRL